MAINNKRKATELMENNKAATPTPEAPSNIVDDDGNDQNTPPEDTADEAIEDYEQIREQRMKENQERLMKLGILDLSRKVKAFSSRNHNSHRTSSFSERKSPLKLLALSHHDPPRRSSRLQHVAPVTYVEPKPEKVTRRREIWLEEGVRPEVYTEEHEKLLGSTEKPWELFVDGYASQGNRIYDPVKGKTCHQCRQKTLGLRTRCCKCDLVRGQFCGDCLYTRYGEHVEEANENPNWVCPPCRDICNCSLCRKDKGWAPTGYMYRQVIRLGFRSVAHYLIMTKRAPPISEETSTAKRSLLLPDDKEDLILDHNKTGEKSRSEACVVDEFSKASPKPVGRPRKKCKTENADVKDSSNVNLALVVVNTEVGAKGGNDVTPVHEANQSPRRRGRPRKASKKETIDQTDIGTEEANEGSPSAKGGNEGTPVHEANQSLRRRGRPRKASKKETVDQTEIGTEETNEGSPVNELSQSSEKEIQDKTEVGTEEANEASEKEIIKIVDDGEDSAEVCEAAVMEKTDISPNADNEQATPTLESNQNSTRVARSRKGSKKENDQPCSNAEFPSAPASDGSIAKRLRSSAMTPENSIARRLRSRTNA